MGGRGRGRSLEGLSVVLNFSCSRRAHVDLHSETARQQKMSAHPLRLPTLSRVQCVFTTSIETQMDSNLELNLLFFFILRPFLVFSCA